ncbi:SET domain-containing protein-lysine N-methyltransferase [Candidatus Woesearchaeota archaeon]|jgi:uncharacterized protein|nr:SET domain-containing protein-lysine N-methyltransferase [Candidatus Woesearchaeota archaeon]MBT6044630.1 SET domain-containing protein-lysine N-methyltransferase [Candidatus Woesearchaeota archaeon]
MFKINKHEWVKVKRSKIDKKGVFARKDVPKGTYMIEYVGRKITNKEADEISEQEIKDGDVYLFELNKKYTLDGNIKGNDAKYINHSCEPNAESLNEDGHIWIEAVKDIKKGEEITYDYCLTTDDYKDHPCRCGAKSCKKYITIPKKK